MLRVFVTLAVQENPPVVMKRFSPLARMSSLVAAIVITSVVLLSGCSDSSIVGSHALDESPETSVNREATRGRPGIQNETGIRSRLDKNGENSTTYGADHNL